MSARTRLLSVVRPRRIGACAALTCGACMVAALAGWAAAGEAVGPPPAPDPAVGQGAQLAPDPFQFPPLADPTGPAAAAAHIDPQRAAKLAALKQATAVKLPAGQLSLAEAVALLDGSGNATRLVPGADPARIGRLDALDGSYWQAVLAVCAAFDLAPLPNPGVRNDEEELGFGGRRSDDLPQRFPVRCESGALFLGRLPTGSPALLASANGPLLVMVDDVALHELRVSGSDPTRWVDARLRLLLEPRLPSECLGPATVVAAAADGDTDHAIPLRPPAPQADGGMDGALSLSIPKIAPGLAQLRLAGKLSLEIGESVVATGEIHQGAPAVISHGDTTLSMHLVDTEDAKRESRSGPALVCTYADEGMLRFPRIVVTSGGHPLSMATRPGLEHHGNGWEQSVPLIKDVAFSDLCTVEATLSLSIGSIDLPWTALVDLGALPSRERGVAPGTLLQQATMVSWPAGEVGLQQALARLRQGGNQVLLELGADESRHAVMPAFRGEFWAGVLAVCGAFDLTVLPAAQSEAKPSDADARDGSGTEFNAAPVIADMSPVCLGPQRAGRAGIATMQPCGALLTMFTASGSVSTRSRLGVERAVNVACRLRLEPRLSVYELHDALVIWNGLGECAGRALAIRKPLVQRAQEGDDDIRPGAPQLAAPAQPGESWMAAVTGVPAGTAQFTLGGQFVAQLDRPARGELTLPLGERRTVMFGEHALAVSLLDRTQAQARGLEGAVAAVHGAEGLVDGLQLELRTAAGNRIVAAASDIRGQPGVEGIEYLWFFGDLAPQTYTVAITGAEALGTVSQPVRINGEVR